MKLKINNIQYHRNGVCGEPFYVINFDDKEIGNMIGVVFPIYDNKKNQYKNEFNPKVAVFKTKLLGQGNINFGENSFRGDHFSDELIQAINKNNKKTMKSFKKSIVKNSNKLIKKIKKAS